MPHDAGSADAHDDLDRLFKQAVALHQQGLIQEARALYEDCLSRAPHHFDSLHLLGVACAQMGDWAPALHWLSTALECPQPSAAAYRNHGNVLKALQRFEEALISVDRALVLQPGDAQTHHQRGLLLQTLQRPHEALQSFDQALAIQSGSAPLHFARGTALQALARLDEALHSYERAIALQSDYAQAYSNRGVALLALRRPQDALASYDRAIALNPDYAEAHYNRALVLQALQRPDEALQAYDRAIALNPLHAQAHSDRGNVLEELRRLDEAQTSYEQAIALQPDHAQAHWNRSLLLLLKGDFERGWPLYEWRWEDPRLAASRRRWQQPQWTGQSSLAGKTVLLHAEQGLGDTLQFCRYAALVQQLGAQVLLEVQPPLVPLLRGLAGVDHLFGKGDDLPPFDFHCPLLSLPLAFGTARDAVPSAIPYLDAQPDRVHRWEHQIGSTGFRIGINWQGNAASKIDVGRSIPLTKFTPLLGIPGVRLISLQKGAGQAQLRPWESDLAVETLGPPFDDDGAFLDTAAVMMNCHLVITSDTAVAHLAGALGVPVWVALKHVPDWRWMLDREDSPWYPTMRLFRQTKRGDWDGVFEAIAAAVQRLQAGSVDPTPP